MKESSIFELTTTSNFIINKVQKFKFFGLKFILETTNKTLKKIHVVSFIQSSL